MPGGLGLVTLSSCPVGCFNVLPQVLIPSRQARHADAVGRDDLRLIRKDFAARGIDQDLQPVDVVVPVGLVVAERLDTGEVFDADDPAASSSGLSTRK